MLELQKISESGYVPAVGYAYVEPEEERKGEFASTLLTTGKKNTQLTDAVDDHTRFPASSLSKIVFTYLVLQLVQKEQINLDEPLHSILQYERFKVDGEFPEKAKKLTARHVLSHTTGLPNFGSGSDSSSKLSFSPNTGLGSGYSYSGEAFLYLQKVIEKKMKKDLETLAREYVFDPLGMDRSTFLPQPGDSNVVAVHTELGKPASIYESFPHLKYDLELMSSLSDLSQAKKGKIYLSENPREYYVKGMSGSASIPPEIDLTNLATKFNNLSFRSNILAITSKAGHTPHLNAAGSLISTAHDFSNLMTAWLKNMDDPIFKQAFESKNAYSIGKTCGLGWHIYKQENKVIAYQYGENPNTRAFIAINFTDKKGAVFFTNSDNGMSIASQLLSSIGNMRAVFEHMHYSQCDEPGWKETISGKIAEDRGNFKEARYYLAQAKAIASELAPEDKSKERRLEWFDLVQQSTSEKKVTPSLKTFEGIYTNPYKDEIQMSSREGRLTYKQFGNEIKLVQVSETEFLPEKDQSFKVRIDGDQMSISFVHGGRDKSLSKLPLAKSQATTTSYAVIARSLDDQPALGAQTKPSDTPVAQLSEKKQLKTEKSIDLKQKSKFEPSTEQEEVQYHQPKIS